MLTLNSTLLGQVAAQARQDAADHPRWIKAIERALAEIDTNPYLEWQDGHLLIASPSGQVYAANGVCQCEAFAHGQACWHRAAARLVRRYHEAEAAGRRQVPAPADWPSDTNGKPMDWYAAKAATEAGTARGPMGQRISAARAKAQREMDELFA